MALEKSYTLDTDAVGNYWKVVRVTDHRKYQKAEVVVGLFKDIASKDKKPLQEFGFVFGDASDDALYPFTIEALSEEGMNHIKISYNVLKTLPMFSGAIDV